MLFNNEQITVPKALYTEWFTARPLSATYADIDYEAYMASPTVIGVHSAGRWQTEGYTLEENRRQATQHAADHAAHRSFAFILLSPDESRSLGCFYINPLQPFLDRVISRGWGVANGVPHEAMITFWLREEAEESDFPDHMVREVQQWLVQSWQMAGHLWRIRPQEHRSLLALERAGLEWHTGIATDPIGRYILYG